MGFQISNSLTNNPFNGGIINLFAFLGILAITLLSCFGVKNSARFNAVIVFIKLLTILVFIAAAIPNVNPTNWHPFLPFGFQGVMQGAALVFFAYIGFDALSTTVEEAVNPTRDVPIGIIVSLLFCTFIYILVAGLLTGIVPYQTLNVKSPVAESLLKIGHHFAAGLVAAGAIAGLTTVMLVMFYGASRICLAIARDGLIPHQIAEINPKTHTPVKIILILGTLIGLIAAFTPINQAAELVNIGTLSAFVFVCGGVMLFRKTHSEIARPFRLPFNPLIPILGIFFCLYLMFSLPAVTWWRFLIWTIIGIIIYFAYGIKKSKLAETSTI